MFSAFQVGPSWADEVAMPNLDSSHLSTLVEGALGARRRAWLLRCCRIPEGLSSDGERVSRAELAMALAMVLFDDVCARVPLAAAYAQEALQGGRQLVLDHGALRTVAAPSGALPVGREVVERVLVPLGYARRDVYPLDRIGMTGHAYGSTDLAEGLPQYFVSELHPERFSPSFQAATLRVIGSSVDPLGPWALEALAQIQREGALSVDDARRLLPALASLFRRLHDAPSWEDYELLLAESPEMAWIATEGHAFNHATDRVEDVRAVAEEQRALGRPIKDSVEVSRSGRVIQTAFRAGLVERVFRGPKGEAILRTVPGSFHEFITRRRLQDGRLDLAFDASNAQGIFKMTSPRSAS